MKRIPLWIPIRSLGAINVYAFYRNRNNGVSLVDAGMLSGRSILDLAWGLKGLGFNLCDVEKVVLTHFHVDHSSLLALLLSCDVEVYMGRRDVEVVKGGVRNFVEAATNLYLQHGTPVEEVEAMLSNHPALKLEYAYDRVREADIQGLGDGDTITLGGKKLEVIEAPGHTPGSILLYSRGTRELFTGDTLLPGITPHVTIHDPGSDPLGEYLESLERISSIEARIAYPGHREPLEDPRTRALELIRHHQERLSEIEELVRTLEPVTAYEVAKRVRWRTRYSSWSMYPPQEKFFAMGETLAHLRRLEVEGRVAKGLEDGIYYWRPA